MSGINVAAFSTFASAPLLQQRRLPSACCTGAAQHDAGLQTAWQLPFGQVAHCATAAVRDPVFYKFRNSFNPVRSLHAFSAAMRTCCNEALQAGLLDLLQTKLAVQAHTLRCMNCGKACRPLVLQHAQASFCVVR